MSSAADKKRWAILPPPSSASSQISGEFPLTAEVSRRRPARQAVSGKMLKADVDRAKSDVEELEPSDSERVTEVPPTMASGKEGSPFLQSNLETIPAPPWHESDD